MKEMIKQNKNLLIYSTLTLIVVLGILGIWLWSKADTDLELVITEEGTLVFVNESLQTKTSSPEQKVKIKKLPEGENMIILAKENYHPWIKYVEIEDRKKLLRLTPFLIELEPRVEEVSKDDPAYSGTISKIENLRLPWKGGKSVSSDGNVSLWVEKNSIYAEWIGEAEETPRHFCTIDTENLEENCGQILEVLSLSFPLTSVDFYKNRNDVIIFSMRNGIYATEMNKLGTQNFQPIYEGSNPSFYKEKEDLIFVKEGLNLYEIKL